MDRGAWQATVHATMGSQRVRDEWAANEFQNSSCNLGSSKTLKNVPFSPLRYRNNVLNVSTHLCNSIQLTFIYFYIHLTIEQHRGVLTLCIESPGISYARPPNRQFLHFPDFPFLDSSNHELCSVIVIILWKRFSCKYTGAVQTHCSWVNTIFVRAFFFFF